MEANRDAWDRLNERGGAGIHEAVQTDDNVVELRGDRETSATPRSFDDLFLDQHDRLYRALYFITGSSPMPMSWGSTDLGGPPGLRLAISYLESVGYEQIIDSCDEASVGPSGGLVRCSFDLHLLRSNEIGRGPFGPAELDLSVVDGEIVRVSSMSFDYEEAFSSQVWEPFAEWVSTTYPEDAARMYVDKTRSSAHLTEGSVQLWERHTRQYAQEVKTNG
jgi:hypothetical protein